MRCGKHIKGDRAELIAQEFFIKKGYIFKKNLYVCALTNKKN